MCARRIIVAGERGIHLKNKAAENGGSVDQGT